MVGQLSVVDLGVREDSRRVRDPQLITDRPLALRSDGLGLVRSFPVYMKKGGFRRPFVLAPESQARDQRPIPLDVFLPQVIEQPPALADHHQQTTPGVMVLGVGLEMLRQLFDAL